MITRETRRPRDIVRAPTPPPIIKRVVERAPTPEPPVMERVIIRPQAQEIVERVIEQPRTPPPRIIEKEMQEEAPPPIVRTRVIKVDRPPRGGFSQPASPYCGPVVGLPTFSPGMVNQGTVATATPYRAQSIVGSLGRPAAFPQTVNDQNPSFSSASSFEYFPPAPNQNVLMMPNNHQTMGQPMQMAMIPNGQVQQQFVYRPVQQPMHHQVPPVSSSFGHQTFAYHVPQQHPGMSFGYRPMFSQQPQTPQQQHQSVATMPPGMQATGRMIPSGMPMMTMAPPMNIQYQPTSNMMNPMAQQLVY